MYIQVEPIDCNIAGNITW